ncbi:MAG: AbrB/MazE/SpoVT family DNA-binding domain-containing protein [Candidatus Micrarchaeota archaeon]
MTDIAFTRLSAKGQVVIPAWIRRKLKFRRGKRLVVIARKGKLLIQDAKKLESRFRDDFSDLLEASISSTKFWNNAKDEVWNNV